jgi:histidyl-tRNA synthetase
MSEQLNQKRLKARLAKGFRDIEARELRGLKRMLAVIEEVYERYGFEPVEQPFIEYTDALGKFLPDQDRPGEGVFSFKDDDDQWLSLRYDLTAPLARYVAENYDRLPKPYRSYRQGWVFRNEKPGPGRYRQFLQFDADTVGAATPAADAEVCMMAADTLKELGLERGQYVMKVSNRKLLEGIMENAGLVGHQMAAKRTAVLRAIDKLDRLGGEGVFQLLGKGREDESGDFTRGADLTDSQIARIMNVCGWGQSGSGSKGTTNLVSIANLEDAVGDSVRGREGVEELSNIIEFVASAGYEENRILIDPSVVRGLEYYTGPVFEAELLFDVKNEQGQAVRFGSVGGGGRYDDLVSRFRGEKVPATGFSFGVSRLYAALDQLGKLDSAMPPGPIVVLVMDRSRLPDCQRMVTELRNAGVNAELYLGASGLKAQMKYADKRGASLAVIEGEEERSRGEVQIKDLAEGARSAERIESREAWREARPAQVSVPRADLVGAVKRWLEDRRT